MTEFSPYGPYRIYIPGIYPILLILFKLKVF